MHFNRCTNYTSYMQLHTCIYFKVFLIHLDMRKKILQVIIDQSYNYSLWYQWLFLHILKSLAMTGQWNSFCQLTTSGPILYSSHTVQHMVFHLHVSCLTWQRSYLSVQYSRINICIQLYIYVRRVKQDNFHLTCSIVLL